MADKPQNKVAAVLRDYAIKIAAQKSAGTPDRMTVADGQGGISTEKKQPPTDPGEGEVKRDQPADGKNIDGAAIPGGSPDRLTVADGQGGITAQKGSPTADPGEGEVKQIQPADGEARKAAGLSERAKRIRAAVTQANPAIGARLAKEATPGKPEAAAAEKKAGSPDAPAKLEFSEATLAKIASAILSTDEGVQFTHDLLEKQAGEAAARAQIAEALNAARSYDQNEQVKMAAFNELTEKVASIHGALDEAGITEADAGEILKQAAFHQQKIASLTHPLLKAAYVQGMDDAALLGAADEAQGAPPAEGGEGAPPVDAAMPMGGEELSEEEILQLLEEMIASGEITEEDVMAAIEATGGAGGDPAAGGADPAAAGGDPLAAAGGAPPMPPDAGGGAPPPVQ